MLFSESQLGIHTMRPQPPFISAMCVIGPRVDLGAGREVRAHAAEDLHVGMELAHVVGQPRGLIEVTLDDEAAHARRLRARVEIERVDRAGGLPVARTEAVGILVRVHVDGALQRRIVRRGIAQRVVRPSASRRTAGAPAPRAFARFALLRRAVLAHAECQGQADGERAHGQVSHGAG